MTFILRLIAAGILVVAVVIVFLLTVYAIVWIINRGLQWGAENIGGELGNMFQWLWQKAPKIKFERKVDEEKSENRKIV